jgi:hypothetical protein
MHMLPVPITDVAGSDSVQRRGLEVLLVMMEHDSASPRLQLQSI